VELTKTRPGIQKVLEKVFVSTSTAKEAVERLQNYAGDA
jgi:hypothetical protein